MTDLQNAIRRQADRVLFNIARGLDGTDAREDAIALFRAADMRLPAETPCPACSAVGAELTDDPQVLRCRCGAVFTTSRHHPITMEAAIKFVKLHLPMAARAGDEGQFHFDFFIMRPSDGGLQRIHGWADNKTRQVVQVG